MFNVGDYVRVKRDLEVASYNGLSFNLSMKVYRGRVFKIDSKDVGTNGTTYKLENVYEWYWNDDMLESISEEVYNMERDRVYCADCGRDITDEEQNEVEGGNRVVCDECYEHYYECEYCHEMVYEDNMCSVGHYDDTYVCESCRDNYYTYCPDCEHYYRTDDMIYDEDENTYYCEECYDNRPRNLISGYHNYHRGFELLSGKDEEVDKSTRYLGTESEMENEDGVDRDCIEVLKDKFDAILSHDGSLETSGAMEWVDDARTMQNHYEVYEEKKRAFEMLRNHGYRSHDTSTCGLHIHVSRPYQVEIDSLPYDSEERKVLLDKQNEVIDRVILIMEAYKNELIKFSRRKSFGWCQWLSDVVCNNSGKITSIDYIKKNKHECMGHRRALNLENHNTIEFRIFKGTLNVDTYYASIELVNNIMELCGDLSLPVEKITWAKLTRGKFVSEYVKENHIWTTKTPIDTSDIDRIWSDIKNKKKIKLMKKAFVELKNWYNDYKKMYDEVKNSEEWNKIYMTAYKLNNYSGCIKSLKKYQEDRRFEDFAYRLNDTISYDLAFDDDRFKEIRENLKNIVNALRVA